MNFIEQLLHWYSINKRPLPWRNWKDPYIIWVSEIILQQTRVNQGIPYFYRFIDAFPKVSILAQASEQSVLNVWKGLGYYSRARNMHHTAQHIMETMEGIFPVDYSSLLKLKGIGSYTAAAIASICNDEKVPAIDGNVTRVLARYFGLMEPNGSAALLKKATLISLQLIPDKNPGNYNQAMMEYGALVCTPQLPKCDICYFREACYAYTNNLVNVLPTKKKEVTRKVRYFNYLHIVSPDGQLVMKKRSSKDIWQGLWDLPLLESTHLLSISEVSQDPWVQNILGSLDFIRYTDLKHQLTHQTLHVRFFTFRLKSFANFEYNDYSLVDLQNNRYPISRLLEKFLKIEANLLD